MFQVHGICFYEMPYQFMHVSDALSNEYAIHSRTLTETKTFPMYYCDLLCLLKHSIAKQGYVLKEVHHQFISSWSIRKGVCGKRKDFVGMSH